MESPDARYMVTCYAIKAALLSNKAQSSAIVFQKLWGEVISIADEVHPNVDMQIYTHVLVQFEQKCVYYPLPNNFLHLPCRQVTGYASLDG